MDKITSSGWIVSPVINQSYIASELLKNEYATILITYETINGRRYVKQALCNHGYVSKGLKGEIVAWRFLPTPYDGT